MKKLICLLSVLTIVLCSTLTAHAAIILEDWQFNPSGVVGGLPGVFQPIDKITFIGTALVNQPTYPTPGAPFNEYGAFAATGFENDGTPIVPGVSGLGVSYELTGVLTGSGVNTTLVGTDQNFVFTTAHIDMYLDTVVGDYGSVAGSATSFYGANNGTLIASFDLLYGGGDLDFAKATPDGSVDILFKAGTGPGLVNGLLPGVWFDKNGVDLSTFGMEYNIALTDSNNNVIIPNALQGAEWFTQFGIDGTPNLPTTFWTRSDGSFAPGVVPEPATMLLFGIGTAGLAVLRKKKSA